MPPQRTKLSSAAFDRPNPLYQPPHKQSKRHTQAKNPDSQSASSSPWKPHSKSYSHGVVGLHEEIQDFYSWIIPNPAEIRMRKYVVDQVSDVIRRMYPLAIIEVFGSFKTGLYLPSSDLDLQVFGKWEQLPFFSIQQELVKAGVCTRDGVRILDKVTVPILKILHQSSGVKVDISFNMVNGLNTAKFICDYTAQHPCLAKLFLFLKQFLYQRDLNEVFIGGISSYAIILMLISFLQMHPRIHSSTDDSELNLGVLLLEFLELYGRHFNYAETTIRVRGKGSYITKKMMKQMMDQQNPGQLSIEDPVQPGNDVCRTAFGAIQVKQAFEYAFAVLSRAVMDPGDANSGVLQRVMNMSKEDLQYRQWVEREF